MLFRSEVTAYDEKGRPSDARFQSQCFSVLDTARCVGEMMTRGQTLA